MRYQTAQEAIDANPSHPIVVHGLYCRDRCAHQKNIDGINNVILSYFNKK